MVLATITSKGQLTIPKAVRDFLKLSTGDKVEIVVTKNGEGVIRPISKKVDEVFGILHKQGRKTISIDEMNLAIKERMKKRNR